MFSRQKSPSSRDIADAADRLLLSASSAERLTPARVAQSLAVSTQDLGPDLGSGDQVCLHLLTSVAGDLHAHLEATIRGGGDFLSLLTRGMQRFAALRRQYPGLHQTLLSGAEGWSPKVRAAARHLVSAQTAFASELLQQAHAAGQLAPALDAERSASTLVALVHGYAAHARLLDRPADLTADLGSMLADLIQSWTVASNDERQGGPDGAARPTVHARAQALRALDVRPTIARGEDPLGAIVAALDQLGPSGVLKLSSPFRPVPLIALLQTRGHAVTSQQVGQAEWSTEIIHGGQPEVADLRDLEPPEPLERVLEAASALEAGGVYLARLPRYPRLLVGQLTERGISWDVHEEHDGSALLRLWRPR